MRHFFFFPVQVELKDSGTSGVAQRVFKNALQLLQDKGLVFQRDSCSDKLYYVIDLQPSFPHGFRYKYS